MRRLLTHPTAGKFRSTGSVEWPNDKYTRKRLAEGSIKLAAPKQAAKAEPAKPDEAKADEPADRPRGRPRPQATTDLG